MSSLLRLLRLMFWHFRYRIYDRDVTRGLREGRGSRENPLTIRDLAPVMKMLGRLKVSDGQSENGK